MIIPLRYTFRNRSESSSYFLSPDLKGRRTDLPAPLFFRPHQARRGHSPARAHSAVFSSCGERFSRLAQSCSIIAFPRSH